MVPSSDAKRPSLESSTAASLHELCLRSIPARLAQDLFLPQPRHGAQIRSTVDSARDLLSKPVPVSRALLRVAVAGTVLVTAAALRTRTACTQLAQPDRPMQAYAVGVDMDERARDNRDGLCRALPALMHTSRLLPSRGPWLGPSSWATIKGHGS